jgi:hypothetical protein
METTNSFAAPKSQKAFTANLKKVFEEKYQKIIRDDDEPAHDGADARRPAETSGRAEGALAASAAVEHPASRLSYPAFVEALGRCAL